MWTLLACLALGGMNKNLDRGTVYHDFLDTLSS